MYIANKTKTYPCAGYFPQKNSVSFSGVEGLTLPVSGEIRLVSEDNDLILAIQDCGDYARQTYADGGLTLTNEPEAAAPTIEELRAAKLRELDGSCSGVIYRGVTIGGKHYSLMPTAQSNLKAAADKARTGATTILYAADGEELTAYSAEDILVIAQAADDWGSVNFGYYGKLKKWIAIETDVSVLEDIHYGSTLPMDLMLELATTLAEVGIRLNDYATAFAV